MYAQIIFNVKIKLDLHGLGFFAVENHTVDIVVKLELLNRD